ncbi:vacuolar protein sorting-associated protein 13C [Salarias fasciatus]|uniref:vacuolar protein sorting-associated protein 13C n=1 Tax=Salarias fasciatus TaxID=181472 RepID=UPI001176996C|nr:vacuolar protein sorting-associated protein 13C [Salarias fasciatus]
MVFESLVSDLLNRFIGDYVENLDKSQLKIGIWGGNVVLQNLKVKENALSELDVPFRVKAGQIGKLTLKIPWKNLYSDAVVASLDGLFLLVVPGVTIKYDAEKEARYRQEAKQRELQRIEDALQRAACRAAHSEELLFSLERVVNQGSHDVPKGRKKVKKQKKGLKKFKRRDPPGDAPSEEKKDSFVEKLATQVIKNLQVKISSVHLRYEDDLSDPQRPLSMGITLSELSLQTTDENWKLCILNEAAKIIYKLGRLEGLCAYWNVHSPVFSRESWQDIVEQLRAGISSKDQGLPHYQYIFKPIFASAKMCLNPSAELELKSPKASLHLEVQNIDIEMTKPQFVTMMELLESIDRMVKNAPYRKFRPDVPVHQHARLWWRYAYSSILEVHIQRSRRMWSWSSIRQHRLNLKAYKTAYKTKLLSPSKAGPETDKQVQDLEEVLDVFSITLVRQQAHMEVVRSGQKLVGKKTGGQKTGGGGGGGFFSSWFGRKGKKEPEEQSQDSESPGLDQLMSAEEKAKLYTAIGYSGSSHSLALPPQYVAVVVSFQLLRTSVTIREREDVPEILKIQMIHLGTKISQRPGAQAVRLEAALQHWFVTGLQQRGAVPSLIASVGDSSSSLLSVLFELNPEDSAADQLLRVHSQPVEIIYDALTVTSMVDFFKTGKGMDLEVLTSATLSKLEEIKEKTASGLSHIIETRKVLDLRIDLKPSYLLLPQSGFYCPSSDLLIVDFGSFKVTFSSLDIVLHTEALLATLSFLSTVLSSGETAFKERDARERTEDKSLSAKSTASVLDSDSQVINLKVMVTLGAFSVLLCDQTCTIADIKIQGLNGSLLTQGPQTHISARLQDFAVVNLDPKSVHQKAISIVGNEVFSFTMSLTPNATEGPGYTDTSRTDGRVKLNVGCVQVVYLHKFIMSMLKFTNNFQTAKEAVSAATAQAAEKAASSVRDLAQKSFRLLLDIRLKAPLIIIPQSSSSHNALVMDLGLITVGNSFSLLDAEGCPLPAIVDSMNVHLTQLKLSRTYVDLVSERASTELLEPVNLHLNIRRNLSASWYRKMAAVEVDGDLKPMKLGLSQDDLKVLLRIVTDNLGEAGDPDPRSHQQESNLQAQVSSGPPAGDAGKSATLSGDETAEAVETVKFSFSVESLGLVLYHDRPEEQQRDRRLGEFVLHLLRFSGKILNGGSMEAGAVLTTCTLDDCRADMERATSRMVGCRDRGASEAMVEVSYRQSAAERGVVAVLQKLQLCASVEFLMAVADFFLQALPETPPASGPSAASERLQLRQTGQPRAAAGTGLATQVRLVVVDPEVVFVASLRRADAPALVASFQSDVALQVGGGGVQKLRANLRDVKVLARRFIQDSDQDPAAVTTVLKPCSVLLEVSGGGAGSPLQGSLMVDDIIVKISPFIINTVMTVMTAMKGEPSAERGLEPRPQVDLLWSVMNIYACDFWFLGVDQATEVTESFREPEERRRGESFTVDVKVVQVTLESGLGHRTVPLLLAESSFDGSAQNWSSQLQLKALLTLEVNYFNEGHAVWEPLIERVDGGRRRWNLELEMKTNPVHSHSPVHGDDFVVLPEPRTAFTVCSKDTMNVTLSQSSLGVFHNLAEAFSEGTASTFNPSLKEEPPFTIRNSLGIPLILQHSATLRPVGSVAQGKLHELPVDQSLDLEHSTFQSSYRGKLSTLQRQDSCMFSLSIVPSGFSEISNIAVEKPGRRLYNVRGPMLQESVSVLVQVDAAGGSKVVTVRSPLQIKNHFSVPFAVLKYCPASRGLQPVGLAQPDADFHVALETYRSQLFVRPAGPLDGQYGASSSCVSWKEQVHHSAEVRSLLQCPASGAGLLPLMVSVSAVPDDLRHIASHGEEDWDPAYVLHLHPVATLRNLLPYGVRYLMESSADSRELPEGGASDLLNARVSGEIVSLVLMRYQGRDWHGHVRLDPDLPEFFALCLSCDSDRNLTVDVSVHVTRTGGRLLLSLFSPYWIINKTSRVLQYRAEDTSVKHPADFRDVVLFSFKKRNLFSKNKIQLSVSTSSWSQGFSLDTVGSYGCVRCPTGSMDFLVGVSIQLSSFNLTRIVSLSPFYTLVNKSSYELEVGEVLQTSTRWHYVPSTECLPLWPDSPSGRLCVRVVGSDSASKPFFFSRQDNGTLLSLDMCGGLLVDVNVSDHSTVIRLSDYYDGAAPALLINHTAWTSLRYSQSGSGFTHELKPGEARRFVWDDPTGLRTLQWTCRGRSGELDLLKDETGQFTDDSQAQVHWVSFLDGRQRVLLFTEDVAVVTKARQAEELEQFQQEVKVSLQNLGLSLVHNGSRQEIAYVGITSSGVVWEMKPKNRWKPFSQKNISLLEKTYQNQLSRKSESGWVQLEPNLEVNLGGAIMMMRQPHTCQVRRNFLPGIQVEFKQSMHQRSLRAQLYWLQVDNQLPGAMFPIVFHPVPPPKSIALDSEPRPFMDMSVITRFNQHSTVTQFKYFMALVQEMAVKIDQGFLGSVLALFTSAAGPETDGQKAGLIRGDLQRLQAELTEASLSDSSGLGFFEHFHISPIKLHLSLSLGSSGDDPAQETAAIQSLNLLLKSIGATLTDVDDLVFKLAFFELKFQFYRRDHLMWAVGRHYSEQFLKQMYVLVLGLDVLGNPFGLIRGLSEGVEAFFYEPFQGAVQGPEEFAEGLVIGVRSLLGHTVGGAAGVVSRLTGSVGKGLAAITMDKEYQQKRREEMNRPPRDFGESLAKGGKGLLKGVVGGVTGIVTKPVEGAKKEGAAGFFKGIGKGLVGVVARPTGGIVDMASSTFQGIQRAAESTEEVTRLRPVRLIREDGIIRPYDLTESQGFDLFQRSQIKQLEGEAFRDHCPHPGHRKTTIIITNRRVLCVKEIDFVGHFNKEWECLFENFYHPPSVTGSVLNIYCKEQHKLMLPKKGQEPVRTVQLRDASTAQKLQAAIFEAQVAQQQRRMVRQKSQRFLKLSGDL